MVYGLDTHTLLQFLEESSKIGPAALKILRHSGKQLIVPSIVLAEIKYLAQKGKTSLSVEEAIEVLGSDPRCIIYPLDSNVI